MYLHIGNEKIIKTGNIIGVFDMDTATVSQVTKNFLKIKETGKETNMSSMNLPKSFILTSEGKVWFSGISTSSLAGRIKKTGF